MRRTIKILSFAGLIFIGLILCWILGLDQRSEYIAKHYLVNTDNVKIIGRSQNAGGVLLVYSLRKWY